MDKKIRELQRRITADVFDIQAITQLQFLVSRMNGFHIGDLFGLKEDRNNCHEVIKKFTEFTDLFRPVKIERGDNHICHNFLLLPGENHSYHCPLLNGYLYMDKEKTYVRMYIYTIDDTEYAFSKTSKPEKIDELYKDILSYITKLYDGKLWNTKATLPPWEWVTEELTAKFHIHDFD